MKAIVLAGGRGRRLGELTEKQPKAMVTVFCKPILEHLVRNASESGIQDYLINIGYLGNVIKDYFGDGSKFGVKIQYFESTGKGPEQAIFEGRKYIDDETFCCFCGDNILLPSQIEKILLTHIQRNADVTFTLEKGEDTMKKRVKVSDGRIIGSTTELGNNVLVYNMAMQTSFLDKLYEFVKDKKNKAFAFAMDGLAKNNRIYITNIGNFININYRKDISKANISLGAMK